MRRHIRQHAVDEKMDMTPLIDCVFLLIMFFILTTEITMKAADVELPFALEGKVIDQGATGDISVVVEVVWDREKNKSDPKGFATIQAEGETLDFEGLKALLQKNVEYDKLPPPRGRGRAPEVLPNGKELSQLKVRIRADRRVRSEYLREIFTACSLTGIYKIELSSTEPRTPEE